jgi:hypothetical protein
MRMGVVGLLSNVTTDNIAITVVPTLIIDSTIHHE